MTRVYEEVEKMFKVGQINEALGMIEKSGVVPADSPDLWTLKARCLEQLNRHDDAFQAAYEVLQVGCNSIGILNTLAAGYMRRGDYSSAYDMFVLARDALSYKDGKASFEMKCRQAKNMLKKNERHRVRKKRETSAASAEATVQRGGVSTEATVA